MLTATRVILSLLGLSIMAVGLMFAVIGADATARFFNGVFSVILGSEAYSGGLEHVNANSEMRVLAVFFAAYGALLLWLVPRLESHAHWVYSAIALYFMGGVTRLFSLAALGWPEPLFVFLMVIELGAPILIAVLFALGLRART